MKIIIRIQDEVWIHILGLTKEHNKVLFDKYNIFSTGYYFHPLFRLGRWDGKVSHYSLSGKTYLYLLEEILPLLINWNYEIEFDDRRSSGIITPPKIDENLFIDCIHPDSNQPIKLRYYQVDAVNAVLNHGNGLCLCSTGSGKTLMCAAILKSYTHFNLRSITIVPDRTLIMQTKETYVVCNLDVGEYSGNVKDLNHQHIVSTWQALQNNKEIIREFDIIIVDECHKLTGKVLKNMISDQAANIQYRFGVTGTLPKEKIDKLAVHYSIGPCRYEIPAHVLIEQNVLATLQIEIHQLFEDFSSHEKAPKEKSKLVRYTDNYFPDYSAEKSYLQFNEPRLEHIAELIISKRDERGNVLVLMNSIPQARKLGKLIPDSKLVNGQDCSNPVKRKEIYDMFESQNNLVVLATFAIAGTGLSINRIMTLVALDTGKSFSKVIQGIGRGLRTASDKQDVLFLDITSNLKYSKTHTSKRMEYYTEARYPFKKFKIEYMKKEK